MLYLLIVIAIWLSGTILVIALWVQSERQTVDISLGLLLFGFVYCFVLWPFELMVDFVFPFVSSMFKKLFKWIDFDRVVIKKKTDKYSSMKPHDWSD